MATSIAMIRLGAPWREASLVPARRYGPIVLALAVVVLPALADLARAEWSSEQGAAGPIILASGLWLLWREARALDWRHVSRPSFWPIACLIVPVLLAYVFARIVAMVWLQWLCAYAATVVVAAAHVEWRMLRQLWFPLTYLLFLVPPPNALIGPLTDSRKLWLAVTSVDLLAKFDLDVAYNGTTLYIDQYEILIVNACAGMNSLISLLAIGLFYVYILHRADWRYALLLASLTLPVALLANLVRIVLLLVAVHVLGIDLAQKLVHETAGLVMFVVALGSLAGLDAMLAPLRRRLARS